MKHYVNISRYMCGDALQKQLQQIFDDGLFDIDLRVFFSKSNMITAEDVAYMLKFFDVRVDWDFDSKNIVFIPTETALRRLKNNQLEF